MPPKSANARVLITGVAHIKDSPSPPVFSMPVLTKELMESDKPGTLVALIKADDADSDRLWYRITGNVVMR